MSKVIVATGMLHSLPGRVRKTEKKISRRGGGVNLRNVHDRPFSWVGPFLLNIDSFNDINISWLVDFDIHSLHPSKRYELNVASISSVLPHFGNMGLHSFVVQKELEVLFMILNVLTDFGP
jgi:hypothetical protein